MKQEIRVIDLLRPYAYGWMLLPLAVLVVGWLLGGGYLLQRRLHKLLDQRRPPRLGDCVLSIFLAGAAGLFSAATVLFLFYAVAVQLEAKWLAIPGSLISLMALLALSFLVIFARHGLTLRQSLAVATPPILAVLGLTIVLGVPTGTLSYWLNQREKARNESIARLLRIYSAIEDSYERRFSQTPKTLQAIADTGDIDARYLASPNSPDRAIGYFYFPRRIRSVPSSDRGEQIIACEFADCTAGAGRVALLLNRECHWYSPEQFQALLDKPDNVEFAKALHKAEAP